MRLLKASLVILFLTTSCIPARCEENPVRFPDLTYPITITISPATEIGAVIYETQISEPALKDYDTVLIQGEMPDPNLLLQIRIKNGAGFKTYNQTVIRRFDNGRFWAKYKIGRLTSEPLKAILTNKGVTGTHNFIIYEMEAFRAAAVRENPSQAKNDDYQPDPGFFIPTETTFPVVRRETWKAAPPTQPYTRHAPFMFTLHHTQGYSPKNLNEALKEVRFIQDYHQNAREFIDIGYHFLIDAQGNLFEGRPINVQAAHVKNRNTGNVGISIMGNYHPPVNQIPTEASIRTFAEIGKYVKETYNITVSTNFVAHRDANPSQNPTDCPGDVLYAMMPQFTEMLFPAAPIPPGPVRAENTDLFSRDAPPEFPALMQLMQWRSGK